ncbi:MAG: GNAT family N-acetyltransferase [Rhodospirillaceae bacterium]|jgi:RimJ/RimL family protein N-acetyltransferase|nr:GNAT family N-acetyltransferase [Rhodospirillaceae bacterium]
MRFELTTCRLLLRPFDDGDQAAMADLFADEAVRRQLAMAPMGTADAADFAARFIRASRDEWQDGGCGVLAIVARRGAADMRLRDGDEDRAIGYCGLRLLPDRISAVELSYALAQIHWGRGLAVEAARAVLDWGFANLPVREILAITRPEHAASRRVMEKLGLVHRGETDRYYGETLAAYGLTRADLDEV